MIARRRQGTIYDLRQVSGIDSGVDARLGSYITVRGTGVIDVNAAPREVLRTLPGLTEEAVFLLVNRRSIRPVHSADELAGLLSRSSRTVLLSSRSRVAGSVRSTPGVG